MLYPRRPLVLGLTLLGLPLLSLTASADTWQQINHMNVARNAFPAVTNTTSSNIYMLGGRYNASGYTTATTEYVNPAAATPLFTRAGNLAYSRSYVPAVPIQSSTGPTTRVLLPGGFSASYGTLRTAEIFDTSTGTSKTTGSLASGREQYDAVQLQAPATGGYGPVLAIGGFNGNYNTAWKSCELYDYSRGRWSATASLNTARFGTTSLLLPDGRVMVVGGRTEPGDASLKTVEYYTPAAATTAAFWTQSDTAHSLNSARFRHTMTVIGSDSNPVSYPILLVTGGYSGNDASGQTLSTAEIGLYDTTAKQYRFQLLYTDSTQTTLLQMSHVNAGRMDHTATLLSSGKVLIVGGWDGITHGPGTTLAAPDLISVSATTDASGNTIYVGSLTPLTAPTDFATRHEHTAISFSTANGNEVLICGGLEVDSYGNTCLSDAWIYTP